MMRAIENMLIAGYIVPKVDVELIGRDMNAFDVLARCRAEMVKARWPKPAIDAFLEEAMAGNYDHLLQTVIRYCDDAAPEDEENEWEWDDDDEG